MIKLKTIIAIDVKTYHQEIFILELKVSESQRNISTD